MFGGETAAETDGQKFPPQEIFGEGGVKAEAKKRGIEMLGEIPISSEVRKSSDSGIPIIISDPKSVQSQNYRKIAKAILTSVKIDEEALV